MRLQKKTRSLLCGGGVAVEKIIDFKGGRPTNIEFSSRRRTLLPDIPHQHSPENTEILADKNKFLLFLDNFLCKKLLLIFR
jgi:hypothetical protein